LAEYSLRARRTIAFRADASSRTGAGHVMRCLTLATCLKEAGAEVAFVTRSAEGDLAHTIERARIPVHTLPALAGRTVAAADPEALLDDWEDDAQETMAALGSPDHRVDWLVVDHYGLDARWHSRVRQIARNVMVIDDLANRRHDCDLLLDQNLPSNPPRDYDTLVPAHARLLVGPRYALLRPEFRHAREGRADRDGKLRRVLVFFGGVDLQDDTSKALAAIAQAHGRDFEVDVIVGASNPHVPEVASECKRIGAVLHHDPSDIASILARADLAIGATGATSWERCCVGLPAIVISLAPNQEPNARALHEAGLALYLGRNAAVTSTMIASTLQSLASDPARLTAMSAAAKAAVDARGVDRVVMALTAAAITLRRAEPRDRDDLYLWRNHEETRRYAHDSAAIAPGAHAEWLERTLADPDRILLIAESEGEPVGVLRYDCAVQQATISIYLVPGRHGRGYGPRAICEGHRWLQTHRPVVRTIRAEVLADNAASVGAFTQAGYRARGGVFMKALSGA
jgi:UDP-2,4-diacetamido-2,4,6-trideoxy-beta-L-altropyranose hydrolase